MSPDRHTSHTITRLTVHLVWTTKYRYELLAQICDAEDVHILSGVVGKDHVHMHLEYPPSISLAELVQKLKGRTSRKIQEEFPDLSKRYW